MQTYTKRECRLRVGLLPNQQWLQHLPGVSPTTSQLQTWSVVNPSYVAGGNCCAPAKWYCTAQDGPKRGDMVPKTCIMNRKSVYIRITPKSQHHQTVPSLGWPTRRDKKHNSNYASFDICWTLASLWAVNSLV